MTGLEIALLLIGVVFVVGSFFVAERLTPGEVNQLSNMSKDQMNQILDNSFKNAQQQIETKIEEQIDVSVERMQRKMQKDSEAGMASIKEYSDQVMEDVHKTHTEVMFLYSMLTDKEDELKKSVSEAAVLAAQLNRASEQVEELSDEPPKGLFSQAASATSSPAPMQADGLLEDVTPQEALFAESLPPSPEEFLRADKRAEVLKRRKEGVLPVDIARELGIGKGEVQLILGLYEGGSN